jgi:hypothetical protein
VASDQGQHDKSENRRNSTDELKIAQLSNSLEREDPERYQEVHR